MKKVFLITVSFMSIVLVLASCGVKKEADATTVSNHQSQGSNTNKFKANDQNPPALTDLQDSGIKLKN